MRLFKDLLILLSLICLTLMHIIDYKWKAKSLIFMDYLSMSIACNEHMVKEYKDSKGNKRTVVSRTVPMNKKTKEHYGWYGYCGDEQVLKWKYKKLNDEYHKYFGDEKPVVKELE